MKRLQIAIAITVLGLMGIAGRPASAQNLLTNGSFELPALPPGTGFSEILAGGVLPGWTVGGDGIDLIRDFWQPSAGAQSIDLSRLTAGTISQTVATTPFQVYNLIFDMAGNPDSGDPFKDMQVGITNSTQPSSLQTFNITGFSRSDMGWSQRTIAFVALSNTTTISFTSLENNAFGPALDNVRLFEDTAAGIVPEPATFALFAPGLALAGLIRRRRRK
jgi:choice-of-anchor C domain-containing protein